MMTNDYEQFLAEKIRLAQFRGFDVAEGAEQEAAA